MPRRKRLRDLGDTTDGRETRHRQAKPERSAVGERIRDARKRLGLSQIDLAKQIDLTDPAVAQWEMGRTSPSIETLGKLAAVLHVSLDWLVLGRETSGGPGSQTTGEREPRSDAVQLDAALLRQAYELGIDVIAALEEQLRGLVGQARRERWLEENRGAIADANAFVARHRLWSDGKRQF